MLALFFCSFVKGIQTVPKLYGEKPGKDNIRRREKAYAWILAGWVDFEIPSAPGGTSFGQNLQPPL